MKRNITQYLLFGILLSLGLVISSCNDFLAREPLDQVTPSAYLKTEADLAAYSIKRYSFSTHGGYGAGTLRNEDHTDNAATTNPSLSLWVPDHRKVPNKSKDYTFEAIRQCNYFFETVLPRYANGEIQGSDVNIKHYIGEMYFLRAWNYFTMLKRYGDFPILKNVLVDDKEVLIEASKRAPRNEVARFILQDLDSAAYYMQPIFKNKNRLSSTVANLVKSRVALYEGSWLTYHRGTPFVPGGDGWPGKAVSYNQDFTIDIDGEIDFFLTESMKSSKLVADAISLTENSRVYNPTSALTGWNLYFDMFGAIDMNAFDEVLFWRAYSTEFSLVHGVNRYIRSGGNYGITKGLVDAFPMKNGLPIYAAGEAYKGDTNFENLKKDRDGRLQLFLATPEDVMILSSSNQNFRMPYIVGLEETRDVTGYYVRKCYNHEFQASSTSSAQDETSGSIVFRAAEAYLNYIEASYMKEGTINADADKYWRTIRKRAGIEADYMITVNATNLDEEAKGDWGVYSASNQVDKTLYNIRRERRCEMMLESLRWDDLKRWRALDQVSNYQIEGFNLWAENHSDEAYKAKDNDGNIISGESILIPQGGEGTSNVSSSTSSTYLRPYQVRRENNEVWGGYTWTKANYLDPLPVYEMLLTSVGGDISTSPLYQNPYWPSESGGSAEQ